jgi:hypothetical protein
MKTESTLVRFSASIKNSALRTLKRRAKRLHGGNVSAVIAEFAEWAKEREGREALLEWLGDPPTLREQERADLDREFHGNKVRMRRKPAGTGKKRSAA